MAANGRRGGDRVLESRHLIGLFLGVVLLCGVFFTLGYVMGRTQYGGAVHAETIAPPRPAPARAAPDRPASKDASVAAPAPSEWDFYPKNDTAKKSAVTPATPEPAPALETVSESPAPEPAATPRQPVVFSTKTHKTAVAPRHAAKASIVLQVAALRHESDAVEMARLLHKKRFPSFVSSPLRGETLYRVQVGPYADEHAADAAKAALDRAGFKAIIKH
jgi:DedD protein